MMTPGVGLNTWERIGSINRELKPYVEYVKKGWNVKILTFDKKKIPELPKGIEADRYPHYRLLWLLPWLEGKLGKWADIIKTNQSSKAYFYTKAATHWKKPILLRCGYVYGEYLETTLGLTQKVISYQRLEAKAFNEATHCEVPTEALSEWIQRKYNIPKHKITVIPNFVDTDIFKPLEGIKKKERSIISVGRLNPVKQFDLLIKACAAVPGVLLTIVGEGPERSSLENLAEERGVTLRMPGNLPNEDIPKILQEHEIFAITSQCEGHPKSLLEAMACGCVCLGVDAPGIRNNITHMENGLICSSTVESISNAIKDLLQDDSFTNNLKENARIHAVNNYSFDKIFEKEFAVVELLNKVKTDM